MKILLLIFALIYLSLCQGDVDYRIIGNNMVLQRDSDNTKLFGSTSEGVLNVNVAVTNKATGATDGYTASVTNKKWEIKLKKYPAGGPYDVSVKASKVTTYTNVLFGDVHLCSGQSNMEMAVANAENSAQEIKDSINYPNLRLFRVARNDASTPQDNVGGQWRPASPDSVSGNWADVNGFSAACYFYGRSIYKSLNASVPIGLIETDWGGTRVETWMSPDARKVCNDTKVSNDPNDLSHMWNGQVLPLLNYQIKSAIWYQGESNAGDDKSAERYRCSFPEMIKDWRQKWGNGDFPFYFVEISGWNPGGNWGRFRLAQREALKLPNTYFVSSYDIGDPTDIHPTNKQEVGRRLALIARKQIYGQDVVYKGPEVDTINVQKEGTKFTLKINLKDVVHLIGRATPRCGKCCTADSLFSVFTNQKENAAPSSVSVKDNIVTVVYDGAANEEITAIQYAMFPYPECVLIDEVTNLPLPTFRHQF